MTLVQMQSKSGSIILKFYYREAAMKWVAKMPGCVVLG